MFAHRLQPHFSFVSLGCSARSIVWTRWIEDRVDKDLARLVPQHQHLEIPDRIRCCLLCASHNEFRYGAAAQLRCALDQPLLVRSNSGLQTLLLSRGLMALNDSGHNPSCLPKVYGEQTDQSTIMY